MFMCSFLIAKPCLRRVLPALLRVPHFSPVLPRFLSANAHLCPESVSCLLCPMSSFLSCALIPVCPAWCVPRVLCVLPPQPRDKRDLRAKLISYNLLSATSRADDILGILASFISRGEMSFSEMTQGCWRYDCVLKSTIDVLQWMVGLQQKTRWCFSTD